MDVDAWVQGFLSGMDALLESHVPECADTSIDGLFGFGHPFFGVDFESSLGPSVEMCPKLGVIVDFDGTLSHLAR